MDTNLVLHIDNHEYQHSWLFWIAISKKPKSKIMVDLGRDMQRRKQIWTERMRVANTANWFDLKHPSLLAKTVGRVRMFTHGCQDIGIHSCSSSALQAHLESGNYPYQSRLRHTMQCPETITGVTYTLSLSLWPHKLRYKRSSPPLINVLELHMQHNIYRSMTKWPKRNQITESPVTWLVFMQIYHPCRRKAFWYRPLVLSLSEYKWYLHALHCVLPVQTTLFAVGVNKLQNPKWFKHNRSAKTVNKTP